MHEANFAPRIGGWRLLGPICFQSSRRPCEPHSGSLGRHTCSLKERGEAIEFLACLVVDDDLAAIRIPGPDQDSRSEVSMKLLFQIEKVGSLGARVVRGVFPDPGA
jgi:hypothetical protein